MDKFPEAFSRFEDVVDVDRIKSFRQLRLAFSEWAGEKWVATSLQLKALSIEARKHGIPVLIEERGVFTVPSMLWRHETVMVKGKGQARYRDLKSDRFIRKP
jgi:hypothetical protein